MKLVDPQGEMLHASWEVYATKLANAKSEEALLSVLGEIVKADAIDLSIPATIVYGHDTRPSCPALVSSLEDGLNALGAKKLAAGLSTTPQLHYLVRCYNTVGTPESYGEPTEQGYYTKLATAYKTLAVRYSYYHLFSCRTESPKSLLQAGHKLLSPLTVDCANGVGAPKLKEFLKVIGSDVLPITVTGDATTTPGALNYQSGADYVKTQQQAPPGVTLVPGNRYCSYDGDADRIVFYYANEKNIFHLLDGDKIAGLVAGFIIQLVKDSGLDINVGVVQTAYANGASTEYLVKVLVRCLPPAFLVTNSHPNAQQ